MQKVTAGLLVVFLVLILFAGCHPDTASVNISKETEAEIIHTYWEKYCKNHSVPENYLAIRVYGSFEDAYVFFVDGEAKPLKYKEETVTIGNVAFHYPSTQRLLVYHKGQIYDLQTAFEHGILSSADLETLPHVFPENNFLTLSDEIKAEIAAVYSPSPLTAKHWFSAEDLGKPDTGKLKYLGTYHDYVILFRKGSLTEEQSKTIAGYTFHSSTSFFLKGYHNKNFYDVALLYREGKLTEEDIAAIHRMYRQYH